MISKKHLIDWWIGTRKLYLHTVFVSSNLLHKNIQKILELYGRDEREHLSKPHQHQRCHAKGVTPSTKKCKWSLLEAQGSKHYIPASSCRIEDNSFYVCFGFRVRFWETALHPALDLENLSKPHDPSAQSWPKSASSRGKTPQWQ